MEELSSALVKWAKTSDNSTKVKKITSEKPATAKKPTVKKAVKKEEEK